MAFVKLETKRKFLFWWSWKLIDSSGKTLVRGRRYRNKETTWSAAEKVLSGRYHGEYIAGLINTELNEEGP